MIALPASVRILLWSEPIDMRKGIDVLGRPFRITHVRRDHTWTPAGGETELDRPLLSGTHAESLQYDHAGNVVAMTDPRAVVVARSWFDARGALVHTRSPDSGQGWVLPDAEGRTVRVWAGVEEAAAGESDAPRHRLRLVYDGLGRPTETWKQAGYTTLDPDPDEVLHAWTVYGERAAAATDHNLLGVAYMTFDTAGRVTNTAFDFAGRPLAAQRQVVADYTADPDWSSAHTALATDWATLEDDVATTLAPARYATAHTWDALGRPVTNTSPAESGRPPSTFTYAYDAGGRWKATTVLLRNTGAPVTLVNDVTYDARGQRVAIVYGSGVTTTHTYHPATFRLTRQHSVRAGDSAVLQDLRYTYDAAGNVVIYADEAQQDVFFSNTVASPTHTYQYDDLGRLVHATGREHARDTHYSAWFGPGAQGGIPYDTDGKLRPYTQSYAYDDAGNLLGLSHVVPSDTGANYSRAYTYAATSHRMATAELEHDVSPQAVTHDTRGRITSMPGLETLTWDDADRLRFSHASSGASQRVFYVYDAAGTRIRKVVEQYIGGDWVHKSDVLYLGGFELQHTFSGSSLWTERETLHAHDGDRRLALVETKTLDDGDPVTTPTPLLRYQLDNHLRSATVETSATGAVISYEEFHPYGTTAYHAADNTLDDIPKRYRYSGKEKDAETGLYYYGARYLAPWLGRWVSTDPAGFVDGPNVYAFVKGRPSMGWDGDGRQEVEETESDQPPRPLPRPRTGGRLELNVPRPEVGTNPQSQPAQSEPVGANVSVLVVGQSRLDERLMTGRVSQFGREAIGSAVPLAIIVMPEIGSLADSDRSSVEGFFDQHSNNGQTFRQTADRLRNQPFFMPNLVGGTFASGVALIEIPQRGSIPWEEVAINELVHAQAFVESRDVSHHFEAEIASSVAQMAYRHRNSVDWPSLALADTVRYFAEMASLYVESDGDSVHFTSGGLTESGLLVAAVAVENIVAATRSTEVQPPEAPRLPSSGTIFAGIGNFFRSLR